jgi:predicted Zn-dependent peptidase
MLPVLFAAALAAVPAATPATVPTPPIYAHADPGAQLVAVTIVVDAGTVREDAQQNGLAALSAQSVLFSELDGETLADRVAAAGGSIGFTVDPGVVRFAIEALPSALPGVCADFARVLAHPDATASTIAAARLALGERIDDDERDPVAVGLEMLRNSYYQGSAGAPAYGTRASLANLGPADVAGFMSAHYRRGGAFATAIGQVDATTNAAVAAALAALGDGAEAAPVIATKAFGEQPKHVVAQRDIGVPFVLVGFAAPALSDHDFAGMLVLRALLDDIAARQSATTLAPFQRGIDVIYDYDRKPATFTVTINGSRIDPSAGLTVLQAVLKTATTKLGPDVIARYKNVARGDWALEAMTLTGRGWEMGAAVNQGADPSLPQSVDAAIVAVTPADVQRIVTTYLERYTVALVLPRSRS